MKFVYNFHPYTLSPYQSVMMVSNLLEEKP